MRCAQSRDNGPCTLSYQYVKVEVFIFSKLHVMNVHCIVYGVHDIIRTLLRSFGRTSACCSTHTTCTALQLYIVYNPMLVHIFQYLIYSRFE